MKTADYCEYIESYCHCPYCESLVSNEENCAEEIEEGLIVICPGCGKKFKVIV